MQPQSTAFISLTVITSMIFGILPDGRMSFNWNEHVYFHILNEFARRMKSNMSATL